MKYIPAAILVGMAILSAAIHRDIGAAIYLSCSVLGYYLARLR